MPNDEVLTGLNLDSFVPYKLSVLSNRVSSAIAREYSERFGLSVPEWRIMAVLGQTPGLSSRAVAERTAMDKVQVSRAVATLVESKRVEKQLDSEDARVTRLSLTTKGKAIYDEVAPLALHLEEVLLGALTSEERATFDKLMAKLDTRVSQIAISSLAYDQDR